jgi:RNA 2',3'-cyclic 3'-phosphodiesterase
MRPANNIREPVMLQTFNLNPSISANQRINLFFALLPEAPAATQAHKVAHQHHADRRMRGQPMAKDRLHITLLSAGGFIGGVPSRFMDLMLGVGDAVSLAPFEITLDRAVSFARSTGKRPYVLLGSDGVADVMPLHCGLVGAMFRSALDLPIPPGFNPHMTLLYDGAHHMELPIQPISWIAREFVLIESHVGLTRHYVRGRWPLR